MKRAVRILGYFVLAYAAICVIARFAFRTFLYPAPPYAVDRDLPAGAKKLDGVAADGVPVHAVHFENANAARTLVLFHGNGETMDNAFGFAHEIRKRGLSVVVAEYRGYGVSASGASPNEEGLYADAVAILDLVAAKGVTQDRVVLMGISLGTGVASEMARRGRGARLILVAPFRSIPDVARANAPLLPMSFVCADKFDTFAKAADIKIPTLVIHGDADETIPFEQGEAVSRAIAGAKLVRVPGGHHNDLFVVSRDTLLDEVVAHATK